MEEPTKAPVVLVDDDPDDRYLFEDVLKEIDDNKGVVYFNNCDEAFDYLQSTTDNPFIIFCDINLPPHGGLFFKERIDNDPELREKSIPFVFYTTAATKKDIINAYTHLNVQGFFEKPSSFSQMKQLLKCIIEYWKTCKHPSRL